VTLSTKFLLWEKQIAGYEKSMEKSLCTNILHLIEAKHQCFLKRLVCSVDRLHVYFSDECKVGVSGLINKQSSRWDTELPLEVKNSMPLNPGVLFGVWWDLVMI
jgi:hypothetical protein